MKVRTAPEAQLLHGAPGSMVAKLKMVYDGLPMSSLLAIQKIYLYVWQWKITTVAISGNGLRISP
jgi:hypothetical protein